MSDEINFWQKYWPQIVIASGIVVNAVRDHWALVRMNKIIFDKNEQLRLITRDQFDKEFGQHCSSEKAEKIEFRSQYRADVQHLHEKIDKIIDMLMRKNP